MVLLVFGLYLVFRVYLRWIARQRQAAAIFALQSRPNRNGLGRQGRV
jgi:hypothetical protein